MSARVSRDRGPASDLVGLSELELWVVGKTSKKVESVFEELELRLPRKGQYVAEIRGNRLTISGVGSGIDRYAFVGKGVVDGVDVTPDGVQLDLRECSVAELELSRVPIALPPSAKLIDETDGAVPYILDFAKLAGSGDISAEARARKRELLQKIAEEARAQEREEERARVRRAPYVQPSIPESSGESRSGGGRSSG